MRMMLDRMPSPIGTMLLVHDAADSLRALEFDEYEARMHRLLRLQYAGVEFADAPAPSRTTDALACYLAGDVSALDHLPVEMGGTPFQRMVWTALRSIPVGTTTTYGRLAAQLGRPGASRAVGMANGANPVSIVVPCHRVIGAGSALTGYGGGLARKRWLLEHEGALPTEQMSLV